MLWAAIFARAIQGLKKTPVLRPVVSAGGGATVCAFVPARNEAEVIGRSVRALLASPEVTRLIVVDDGSTDGTRAQISGLNDPRLEILEGRGPGPGECGKPAALAFAVSAARPASEWLLFVDADVVLEPGAVGALLAAAADRDLVSVIPRVEMERAIEKLVMPSIGALVLAQYPPERVARGDDPIAFANGQVILIRRAVYERIGGHSAVVGEILEDVRLAELAKRSGARLLIADGRSLASTRMYAGWSELVEGWSKNLFLLLGARVSVVLRWALVSVILAWAGVILGLVYGWPIGVLGYLVILSFQAIIRARGGASPAWALLAPIAALLTAGVMLRSAYLFSRKAPIAWKGRAY